MTVERTLSERELNRALLARQHVLQPSAGTVARTLERIGGLQAQYARSMYVGLWSRMGAFARDDLTVALERQRRPGDAHADDDPRGGAARLLGFRARAAPASSPRRRTGSARRS